MNPREIRAIRGTMHEVDFALLMGVSPSTIWRWERKGYKPDGASVVLLELMRDHRKETMKLLWKRLKPKMKA